MFDGGIQITSDFESGNAQLCIKNDSHVNGENSFNIWLQTDSHPYVPQVDDGRVAFFYAVTGIPPECSDTSKRKLKFKFKNLQNYKQLMSAGYSPVYLEVTSQMYQDLVQGKLAFNR